MRSRLFTVLRIAVTLAVLAGLIYKLSPGEFVDTFRHADASLLVAALALMLVTQALVVAKWYVLLRARDVHVPIPMVIRVYCIGNVVSSVLPAGVGGDVYRVYRVHRDTDARTADVTMSVLYERATGYAAMTCLAALGAAFYYGNALIGVVALFGGIAAALALAAVLPRMPFPSVRHDHFLRNLLAHRRELMAVYQMSVFSLLIQFVYISSIALAGRSFGADVSWWYWAFVTWIVAIALLLPLTPGGFGVRESSFAGLIHAAGATAAQGASTGFALGVLLLAANALGLLAVELAQRLGYAQRSRETEVAPAAHPSSLPEQR